jgi:RNA polymerase sigma factor (sigma-70 family)
VTQSRELIHHRPAEAARDTGNQNNFLGDMRMDSVSTPLGFNVIFAVTAPHFCPVWPVCGCMFVEVMLDDRQLLRRYVADGSEAAFGELVARYVNLVYSVALRRTGGDTYLAQLVFTDLARKARSLRADVVLAGWLHRATQYAAAQLLRTEHRRMAREQEAVAMNTLESETPLDWDQIRPLLDEALDELGRNDRDALLLRFFEQRTHAEIGAALGSNEDTARKRVARALEKLRAHLARHGITTPAAVLSTVISVNAVQAAPAGMAVTLTSTALAGAAAGSGTALTLLKFITMTKLKAGIISTIVIASVVTPLVIQHQAQAKLRDQDEFAATCE